MLTNNVQEYHELNLDREDQKVDNLFQGALKHLQILDLSAFYQVVDDLTMQNLCFNHLSSQSLTLYHLTEISLNHCYKITDNGIQWLIGSCHSPKITKLDLSNTYLTGNCFLRKMPHLSFLSLNCCYNLNSKGLESISMTCQNLKYFSISQCKQISDVDLISGFKRGFRNLQEFHANYTNLSGNCFECFESFESLRKLSLTFCSKIRENAKLAEFLSKCQNLTYLDLSETKINGKIFQSLTFSPKLKFLFADLCPNLEFDIPDSLKVRFFSHIGTKLRPNFDSPEVENYLRKLAKQRGLNARVKK